MISLLIDTQTKWIVYPLAVESIASVCISQLSSSSIKLFDSKKNPKGDSPKNNDNKLYFYGTFDTQRNAAQSALRQRNDMRVLKTTEWA